MSDEKEMVEPVEMPKVTVKEKKVNKTTKLDPKGLASRELAHENKVSKYLLGGEY